MAVWFVSRHPGAIDWMAAQADWQVDALGGASARG